ncbi:LCM-domain-containing protein [Saccharata proteae CBS 121410]|uniref:tRNA wybutosine-synthesizing protein 4 n=1 Tax=Saccharata proteae CBS 121410 TaxID=1314787 RepID=A0A9P4HN83_9PEZI|nr:LCM-domain-containing protein [Saccharata proteae CBS 121410]
MAGTNPARPPAAKSSREKRDDDIMLTNDSSIVSKRSVKKFYHPNDPDFFRPFTAKFQRRSPLINRGYWLRMKAIEHTVKSFLEEQDGKKKVVVNLGCGYDPLPFEFFHHYPSMTSSATFVDVDYPQLMQKKRSCILQDEMLLKTFPELSTAEAKTSDVWRAGRYLAVGCDLRKLSNLQLILEDEVQIQDRAVLFIAEVSVAYMDVKSADAVVGWASSFADARFCILEQCLPDGPDHPFAATMLSHFAKLHTYLRVCHQYPTLQDQKTRFHDQGWPHVSANSLWELWGKDHFLSPEGRRYLDLCEPFDEWEEFALFASHYLLLVARNTSESDHPVLEKKGHDEEHTSDALSRPNVESGKSRPWRIELSQTGEAAPSRFSALCCMDEEGFINHGGYGTKGRLPTQDTLDSHGYLIDTSLFPGSESIMCHTITPVTQQQWLLVGGRTSPLQVSNRSWLVDGGNLASSKDDMSPARYRHCAVDIKLSNNDDEPNSVLVFGGREASRASGQSSGVLSDTDLVQQDVAWQIWSRERGWRWQLAMSDDFSDRPPIRFGAAMAKTSPNSGILMGGLSEDGTILDDLWEWYVLETPGKPGEVTLGFRNRTNSIRRACPNGRYARFGANLVRCGSGFLLIGGVAKDNLLHQDEEIMYLSLEAPVRTLQVDVSKVHVTSKDGSRPLFVGVGAAPISENEILITGGGAVCFSMGSFWNTHHHVLRLSPPTPPAHSEPPNPRSTITQIPRVQLHTAAEFDALVAAGQPAIITNLALGPCTQLWTPDYLLSCVEPDRTVIVHSSPTSRMTFATKNFSYHKLTFSDFIEALTSPSPNNQLYLRALASTQPTKRPANLWTDFPTLAQDFHILDSPILSQVATRLHSAPLRISGPVALWLHYDVLANVLCQIHGTKTLRLYPPSDVPHLSYDPGASSSNLDVFDLATTDGLSEVGKTHPHEAFLRPGDVLFIPPAWSHAARPDQGVSIAVNAFWRDLEEGLYAKGRDVYGNRDLAAYEGGRKLVGEVARGFEGVPEALRGFYLERLIGELRGLVEEQRGVEGEEGESDGKEGS